MWKKLLHTECYVGKGVHCSYNQRMSPHDLIKNIITGEKCVSVKTYMKLNIHIILDGSC